MSVLLCTSALAQTVTTSTNVVTMSPFEVTGVPLRDSVNPLTRTLTGVFGDERTLLDTPRSVSSITQALLRERGIDGVPQFVGFAPGASAPAAYGKATTPLIRGDLSETFLNGQRLSYNNFGYLPSFNNVEALDLVRGPGSAVYGSGYFTGGYVNYITKQPQFTPATTVTARLGTWSPAEGGSWLNASWQIDTTAPINQNSAWRLSYEGKQDGTFFHNHGARDDRQDIYAAYVGRLTPNFTLETNAQYMWQNAMELLGVNRPNQDLIDNGKYYTGSVPDAPLNPDTYALAGTIPGDTWTRIPRDATLLSPGDFGNANIARAQVIATLRFSDDTKLINRTLYEYVNRRRYNAFEYAEWVTQHTAENRTEFQTTRNILGLPNSIVAGVTIRLEKRLSYANYTNEYEFPYDITRPYDIFSLAADYPIASSANVGVPGPGGKLFFASSQYCPDTTDSTLWNPALFLQDEITLINNLSLLVGLRGDGFYARANDPLGNEAAAVTDIAPWSDSHNATALSWNASLTYRVTPALTLYATAQTAAAVNGSVCGGGIMLKDDGNGNGIIDPNDFKNQSRLLEAGAKMALLHNTLYAGAALYQQRRSQTQLGGDTNNIKVRSAELELVYQPTTRFNATFNASYMDARYDNSAPIEAGGPSLYNFYAPGQGPANRGTGVGFNWNTLPPGNYRIPGLSRLVINASFSYRLPCGFGGGLDGSWQSEQAGNLANEYHIPSQIFLNAFIFYRRPRWEINIDILNVLNRRNWIHNGDAWSDNTLVFQDLPLRVQGYVKIKF